MSVSGQIECEKWYILLLALCLVKCGVFCSTTSLLWHCWLGDKKSIWPV